MVIRRLKIKPTDMKYVAIGAYLTYSSYSVFLYSLVGMNQVTRMISIVPTVLIYCMAFFGLKQKKVINILQLALLSGLIFGLNYLLFTSNQQYINKLFPELLGVIPFCVLITECDLNRLEKTLLRCGYILLICNMAEPILKFTILQERGYMIYGFRYIPAALIFLDHALKEKKVKYWLLSLFVLLEVFLLGNRSVLLIYSSYLVMYIFFIFDVRSKWKYILLGLLAVICGYSINIGNYFYVFSNILNKFGISSRTLSMIAGALYSDDNSRLLVWRRAIDYIKQKPFVGYGIGGDRRLPLASWNPEQYVHNFFLELWIDFGIIIGTSIIVLLLYKFLKNMKKSNDLVYKRMIVLFAGYAIPKLIVSSSFWIEPFFWILIAFLFSKKISCQGGNNTSYETKTMG